MPIPYSWQRFKIPPIEVKPERQLNSYEISTLLTQPNNPVYDRVRELARGQLTEDQTNDYMATLSFNLREIYKRPNDKQTEVFLKPLPNGAKMPTIKLTASQLDAMPWTEKHDKAIRQTFTGTLDSTRQMSAEEIEWSDRYHGPKENGLRPSTTALQKYASEQRAHLQNGTLAAPGSSGLAGEHIEALRTRLTNVEAGDLATHINEYKKTHSDLTLPDGLNNKLAKATIGKAGDVSDISIAEVKTLLEQMQVTSLQTTEEARNARTHYTVAEAKERLNQMGPTNSDGFFSLLNGKGKEVPHPQVPVLIGSVDTLSAEAAYLKELIEKANSQPGWQDKNKLTDVPIDSDENVSKAKQAALAALDRLDAKLGTAAPAKNTPERRDADGKLISSIEATPRWMADAQFPEGVSGGKNVDGNARFMAQATPSPVATEAPERAATTTQVG